MNFFSFSIFFALVFFVLFSFFSFVSVNFSSSQILNSNSISTSTSSSTSNKMLPLWSCILETKDSPWTVGDKRRMNCKGDYIEKFHSPPQVVFPKKEKKKEEQNPNNQSKTVEPIEINASAKKNEDLDYSLVILDLNMSDHNQASFTVTSYKAGFFSSPFFLQSSDRKIFVQPLSWKVESVLKTKEQLQGFGPMGPMFLSWPKKYKFIFLGLALLFLLFIFFKIYRFLLRKRWKKTMFKKRTALSAYFQLNKDLRKRARSYYHGKTKQRDKKQKEKWNKNYIQDLKTDFCLFLEREFLVPVLSESLHILIKEIKRSKFLKKEKKKEKKEEKKDAIYKLSLIMKEFKKAEENENPIQDVDCEQMTEWIKTWAGKWEDLKRSNETSQEKIREYKRKKA